MEKFRQECAKLVQETIELFIDETNQDAQTINYGSCGLFAQELQERFCKNGFTDITIVSTRDIIPKQLHNDQYPYPKHTWVRYQQYHFDSETPYGVSHWSDIPFFTRAIEDNQLKQPY